VFWHLFADIRAEAEVVGHVVLMRAGVEVLQVVG
jgi:hypothetical protein